jgi:hypothetical protein
MASAAQLYENVDFGGRAFHVESGQHVAVIPPPIGSGDGQASSIHITADQWIVFWEAKNYDEGDDQLWIAPPPAGTRWALSDLHDLPRPHGNNHWGDRILAVSFPGGPPTGNNENRTIVHPDGTITVGNFAEFSLQYAPASAGHTMGLVARSERNQE